MNNPTDPGNDPDLNEANTARQRARRVPPKPAIIGGVDQPGLRPLTRGERLLPFVDTRDGFECHIESLRKINYEDGLRIASTIRCTRSGMKN